MYYCLQGYNIVQSIESQPTFRWNIPPPSLRWKKQSKDGYESRSLTFNDGIKSQKFTTTTVRTSNPTITIFFYCMVSSEVIIINTSFLV
jgi:hypothetical protein